MCRKLRKDDGAVAVTVALLLTVFIILSALVVDMGYWYNVRRQLQSAADAAALAGCKDLGNGATNAEIWSTVTNYVNENAVTPVDTIAVVEPSPGGESDIGGDFVKVTVSSDAVGFFSRVFAGDTQLIRAQSKAQLGYLTGAQTPVPLALPILRVTRIVARVNGADHPLAGSGSSWSGRLPSGSSGTVDIIAYNDQTLDPNYPNGVPETVEDVQRLIYLPVGSRFADVRMPQHTFTSGAGQNVRVDIDVVGTLGGGESIEVSYDNQHKYTATAVDADTYRATFAAPSTDDLWATVSLRIAIVKGKKDVEVLPGEPIIGIRRSTFPIKSIKVAPFVFRAGASTQPRVEVELNEYEPNQPYEMKVAGGGGEAGNFMAIDYHLLRHSPNWRKQDPAEYPDMPGSTSDVYRDNLAGTGEYDFIVHIDDTVWTETGGMVGQTGHGLDTRLQGAEPSNFQKWLADGMPASKRLVFIPITEKVQEAGGVTALRVVSFAVMYIDSYVDKDRIVRGYFVDYAGPGWIVSPNPPNSPLVARAPHLVADDVDF